MTKANDQNMDDGPSLGHNLRRLRNDRGWSMMKMCDVIGMSQSSLSKVENDRMSLNYNKLFQIAERLNVNVSELFRAEDS